MKRFLLFFLFCFLLGNDKTWGFLRSGNRKKVLQVLKRQLFFLDIIHAIIVGIIKAHLEGIPINQPKFSWKGNMFFFLTWNLLKGLGKICGFWFLSYFVWLPSILDPFYHVGLQFFVASRLGERLGDHQRRSTFWGIRNFSTPPLKTNQYTTPGILGGGVDPNNIILIHISYIDPRDPGSPKLRMVNHGT